MSSFKDRGRKRAPQKSKIFVVAGIEKEEIIKAHRECNWPWLRQRESLA